MEFDDVGLGDEIMGSGMAKGAKARGKRIAFGSKGKIDWHQNAHVIYRNNPNVAHPGDENCDDLEWIDYRVGNRLYAIIQHGRWTWNADFRAIPGELYFDQDEIDWADRTAVDVLIEPNVKNRAVNKQWPVDYYQKVAHHLLQRDLRVRQVDWLRPNRLRDVVPLVSPNFRALCAALRNVKLYIGPEGALHHAAAALGVPAVVIFGGYISPQVTGYDLHTNLFNSDGLGCGNIHACAHCRRAMRGIEPERVIAAAEAILRD